MIDLEAEFAALADESLAWARAVEHLHPEFLEGCFRCDLSRDEVS